MSRLLDDHGRLFGRLNVVDLLVVLLVIVLVVFAYLRFASGEETAVRTTLVVDDVRNPIAEQIAEQLPAEESVRDRSGTPLGRLIDVEVLPSPVEVPTADGQLVTDESELYSDVWMVVEGTGQQSEHEIRIESVRLRVGHTLVISGPGWEVSAEIRDVEVVSG